MAMILISHDLGAVAGRTDRVAVMYAGRVVETSQTSEVFDAPTHPYSEALIASTPSSRRRRTAGCGPSPAAPPNMAEPPPGCSVRAAVPTRRQDCTRCCRCSPRWCAPTAT